MLQLYRIETSVVRADKVIFIPFKLIDFNNDDLLLRFRNALNAQIRDALVNFSMLEMAPDPTVRFPGLNGAIRDVLTHPGLLTKVMFGPPVNPPPAAPPPANTTGITGAAVGADVPGSSRR
jgi:hypothetical protein